MEDKAFKDVIVMTRQVGKMLVICSIVRAAEFIVNEWPGDQTKKLEIASHALVEAFEGKMSPGVARMAFIEAAKEADIYIEAVARQPQTDKALRGRRTKSFRAA
jgi:Protein of unknown function (DUF982)